MSESKWKSKNISFETVSERDYKRIDTFLKENFYPDEPIWVGTKLLDTNGSNGLVNKYIANLVKKHTVIPCLKDSTREITCPEIKHRNVNKVKNRYEIWKQRKKLAFFE